MPNEVNPAEQPVTLAVTLAESYYIMNALSQRPFAEVHALFGKLQQQIEAQNKVPDKKPE